jgi:hypothetical protein
LRCSAHDFHVFVFHEYAEPSIGNLQNIDPVNPRSHLQSGMSPSSFLFLSDELLAPALWGRAMVDRPYYLPFADFA